jgi:hypothetical protein
MIPIGKPTLLLEKIKTCVIATLTTQNLTWTGPGSNSGVCNEKSQHNHPSHSKALYCTLYTKSHTLLYNGYRVFPGDKAAGAWC